MEGKRVKHFNYLTFIILIITIGHIVGNFSDIKLIDTTFYFTSNKDIVTRFDEMTADYPKLFTLIKLPFLAVFTLLFFRKSKHNFTEFLILNTYKVCGELLIAIAFTLFAILLKGNIPISFITPVVGILAFSYSVWYYYQYFSVYGYSKSGLFLRSFINSIILFIVVVSVTTFVIGMKDGFDGR